MVIIKEKRLWAFLFLSIAIAGLRGDKESSVIAQSQTNATSSSTPPDLPQENSKVAEKQNRINYTEIEVNKKNKNNGGGGGYGGWGWGGGGGGGGGGGWGWGGGGGGWWGWGCRRPSKNTGRGRGRGNQVHKKRVFNSKDYKIGEFAQCMVRGRCRGMRLDCPLHCGGPCFYDCIYMCKAHCRRP